MRKVHTNFEVYLLRIVILGVVSQPLYYFALSALILKQIFSHFSSL